MAEQAKHTPLPWHVYENCNIPSTPFRRGRTVCARLENGDQVAVATTDYFTPHRAEANSSFIVRAVNAHDDLVAALQTYGEHRSDCPAFFDAKDACNCGLAAALALAESR